MLRRKTKGEGQTNDNQLIQFAWKVAITTARVCVQGVPEKMAQSLPCNKF